MTLCGTKTINYKKQNKKKNTKKPKCIYCLIKHKVVIKCVFSLIDMKFFLWLYASNEQICLKLQEDNEK